MVRYTYSLYKMCNYSPSQYNSNITSCNLGNIKTDNPQKSPLDNHKIASIYYLYRYRISQKYCKSRIKIYNLNINPLKIPKQL